VSGGSHREEDQVRAIERAAHMLVDALKNTGDRMFFQVHPEAAEIANEILQDAGLELVKRKRR
jgi:hypothetical protein